MTQAVHPEHWYDAAQGALLAELARSTRALLGATVEIGTWTGESTIFLANAVAPQFVQAVDWFKGDVPTEDNAARHVDLANFPGRDIEAEFRANIAAAGAWNVDLWVMDWREFLSAWTDIEVAFVHLDGSHAAQEVHDQIAAFLPRMVAGGILAGDDASFPPVGDTVRQWLPDAQVSGNLWWYRCP